MSEITITIASVIDRDKLVAELWCGDIQLGEISQEYEYLVLELYPRSDGRPWTFALHDFTQKLALAVERLGRK